MHSETVRSETDHENTSTGRERGSRYGKEKIKVGEKVAKVAGGVRRATATLKDVPA